jgi:oligopeptide transport system ATP-binding protein
MPLLQVENLRTAFHTRNGIVRAVNDVSFHVRRGETLGIVGESGSGKSVTCYSLMGLIPQPPGRIEAGRAMFDGVDLLHCSIKERAAIRGLRVAMIFQDPMTSLNPYLRVGDQIMEPLMIHGGFSRDEARGRALDSLREVGIQDGESRLRAYPHQFSGGMRQRVMIAMALITNPELLIADEPTTALDVTVQAQILDLIKKLQREHGTAVIFITHDLGVVSGFCDRVQVMYAGRIVESAPVGEVFRTPMHPYNKALQRSIPAMQPKGVELYTIAGQPPDLSKAVPGCPFVPRCDFAREECQKPVHLEAVAPAHESACTRVQQGSLHLREQPPDEMAAAGIDEAFTDVAVDAHHHAHTNGVEPVRD